MILELNAALVVATDSSPRYIQVEEATKVLIESGEIEAIGRDLREFNAVDMGIFLCSKAMFAVVRECVRGGREEWSECVAEYARKHKVLPFDASGTFWVDVDINDIAVVPQRALMQFTPMMRETSRPSHVRGGR